MRATKGEDRSTKLQSIDAIFSGLGAGSKALLEDKAKMTALVTGLSCLALGVYASKNGMRAFWNLWEKKMGRPPLVRETSRWTWNRFLGAGGMGSGAGQGKVLDKIVLQEELSERLTWTTNSLVRKCQMI